MFTDNDHLYFCFSYNITNFTKRGYGYIQEINAENVGKIACDLGAGRIKKEDKIDYTVGIVLNKKVTDRVKKGEILGYIHSNNIEKLEKALIDMEEIIKIENRIKEKTPTIFGICK